MSSEIFHESLLIHAQWPFLVYPDINGDTCEELILLLDFLETTRVCKYLFLRCNVKLNHFTHIHLNTLPPSNNHTFLLQVFQHSFHIRLKPVVYK